MYFFRLTKISQCFAENPSYDGAQTAAWNQPLQDIYLGVRHSIVY
jgi:hypothetical protein